jgi:Pectate lyase superfamily protein/SMP-30/Gluconolactonase/LRE-like region
MRRLFSALLLVALASFELPAQSVYPLRPDDSHAVYLERGSFGAVADGQADDTSAIQSAIDRVSETTGEGIVFVADGRYRISHEIHLWTGIRLIGYGAHRPVFVLGPNTPGFQEGHEFLGTGRYMLQFASRRPREGQPVVDGNEFTFYSAINNIDFEIGPGNPAAIAVRFHVAQHSFLEHMRIQVGDGRAGLEDVGNGAIDLHIEGGEYGIISVRTAPAWQFLLMDSSITGQRRAAIHTQEVGMTLVRVHIAHAPVAVEITHGMTEQLYGRDLVLEDISQSAVVLGDALKAHHQVTLDNIICRNVPQLVQSQDASTAMLAVKGSKKPFIEEHLTVGLEIGPDGRERGVEVHHRERTGVGKAVASDIPALPPMRQWANVRTLGVKGDGSDDTVALQAAIDAHRVLYFPSGTYRISNTLQLKPDSVLIGFNPATTVIVATDDEPKFTGEGDPVPLVQSAKGGAAIMTGLGILTSTLDHRATGLVWRAGAKSFVEDVNFMRGPGRRNPALSPNLPRPAQSPNPGTFNPMAGAEAQYPSLWVKDGGGGLFRGIWTANTLARAGLLVENTTTPSIVYQMSCEHHMHHETQFHNASNWTVYALQTEEENPAGADSFSVDLKNAHQMLLANLFMYRVSRNVLPKLYAVEAANSSDIHFENVHDFSMTRLAFDNSVFDASSGVHVRTRDFTAFTLNTKVKQGAPLPLPAGVFAAGARLQQLASGFSNIAGLTVDDAGHLFFTDAAMHKIYKWNAADKKAELLTDKVPTPMAAAFAGNGTLLVQDYSRSVYSVDTKTGDANKIEGASAPESGTNLMMPVGFHFPMETLRMQLERRGVIYSGRSNMAIVARVTDQPRNFYYAPGTTNAVMAGNDWRPMLQASQWRLFHIGDEHLAASEEDDTTYRVKLDSLQHITTSEFAPRGGSSVVSDAAGNVYVAEGQLYIYNSGGKQIGVVEIPERPSGLAFGGADRKTLYIGARGSLFSLQTEAVGH